VAQNIVVAVAGPLSHAAMRRAAGVGFSAVPRGPRRAPARFASTQRRASVRAMRSAGSSQTDVRVGFATSGLRSRSARALELLVRVLDDGMSARLHRRVCDERGLAYEVGAGVELFEEVGIFDVNASVAHGSVGPLLREVLAILADLALVGPTAEEVARAQRRFAFDLDGLEDDVHGLCDFYGTAELMGMRQSPAKRRRETLALTPADLRRAARRALVPAHVNVTLVGDDPTRARRVVAAELQRFRACLTEGSRRGGARIRAVSP
jgi:predicted Zn-dependent peptidase